MKPNTKSGSFKLSLVAAALYVLHLIILRSQVTESVANGNNLPSLYFYLPYLWVSFAGLLFFMATNKKQTVRNRILAFVLTPFILSPILGILYVTVVLLPIYSLVGNS
jgi:hypothetical protein